MSASGVRCSAQGQARAAVPPDPLRVVYGHPLTLHGSALCDTSRSVSVRVLLVTPFARDASPSVSVGRTRNAGHLIEASRAPQSSRRTPSASSICLSSWCSFEGRNTHCVTAVNRSPGSETGAQFLSSFGGHGWPRRFPRLRSFPSLCRGERSGRPKNDIGSRLPRVPTDCPRKKKRWSRW
jgi:hypothetical protein